MTAACVFVSTSSFVLRCAWREPHFVLEVQIDLSTPHLHHCTLHLRNLPKGCGDTLFSEMSRRWVFPFSVGVLR